MNEALKGLRERAGLTQGELANRLGMATQQYQQIESGARNPRMMSTVKIARVLAEALGVKPSGVLAELTQVDNKEAVA